MKTLNKRLDTIIEKLEKQNFLINKFISDVEKMREIQKLELNPCLEPEAIKEMEAAEAKVDAFLAKRREG
jgi:hypothetical protein